MWTVLSIVGALVLLAIGVGAGYATGAGTRSDLTAAQAAMSTLSQKVDAQTATTSACRTALQASVALDAQWNNLWNEDMTSLEDATSESEAFAILDHMQAQLAAMQQAEGRVATLSAQCTGTAS